MKELEMERRERGGLSFMRDDIESQGIHNGNNDKEQNTDSDQTDSNSEKEIELPSSPSVEEFQGFIPADSPPTQRGAPTESPKLMVTKSGKKKRPKLHRQRSGSFDLPRKVPSLVAAPATVQDDEKISPRNRKRGGSVEAPSPPIIGALIAQEKHRKRSASLKASPTRQRSASIAAPSASSTESTPVIKTLPGTGPHSPLTINLKVPTKRNTEDGAPLPKLLSPRRGSSSGSLRAAAVHALVEGTPVEGDESAPAGWRKRSGSFDSPRDDDLLALSQTEHTPKQNENPSDLLLTGNLLN